MTWWLWLGIGMVVGAALATGGIVWFLSRQIWGSMK